MNLDIVDKTLLVGLLLIFIIAMIGIFITKRNNYDTQRN